MGFGKKDITKGTEFVKYALNNGYDVFQMACDKAYMKAVVDKYYKDLENNKEGVVAND